MKGTAPDRANSCRL